MVDASHPLLQQTSSRARLTSTIRTQSDDSGLGVEEVLAHSRSDVDDDESTFPEVDTHPRGPGDAFPPTGSSLRLGNGDYVPLGDVIPLSPVMSSTGYVVGWTDDVGGRSVVPLQPHVEFDADCGSQHAVSCYRAWCGGGSAETGGSTTTDDMLMVSLDDSGRQSTSCRPFGARPHDNQSDAVRPADSCVLPYITLEQVQMSTV